MPASSPSGTAHCRLIDRKGNFMNPNVPFRNLYSNDTTNLETCISPWHPRGGYTGREELRASVREVAGFADAHLIQLAHGQVPWYKSRIYPFEEHLRWWSEYFDVPYEQFSQLSGGHQYMYDGGDYLADFIEACRDYGQAAFVSLRLNDEHHVENIDRKGHMNGIHSISRFLVEHRHMMFGTDLTRWENRSLNWIYPEVPAHMLSLITEQCESYDIDGFELDFMRHPHFFDTEKTTLKERCAVIEPFIATVRAVLDRTARDGQYRYLSVRVPSVLSMWGELGLVPERLAELGVDIVNVSSSFYCDQWVDRETFVRRMPTLAVYFEICHCTAQGTVLLPSAYDAFTFRRVTPAEMYSTAHLAFCAGAQGVSFFNFQYYREHGCEGRGPFNEPPFHVVGKVRDPAFVAHAPQHFFLARGWNKNTQLERRLAADREHTLEMYVEVGERPCTDGFRLRLTARTPMEDRVFAVSVNGVRADPVADISEPYAEDNEYPPLHGTEANCRAWRVPREAVQNGKNIITLSWHGSADCDPIVLDYVDMFPCPAAD